MKRGHRGSGGISTVFTIIGFVVVALVVGTCVACNDNEAEEHSGYSYQLISHEYDDGCWEGECYDGGYDQEYDQWNSDQNNHNRRNRGAFSPGPFEDSPVDFRDNCISLDCGGRDRERERNQEEMR